MATKHILIKRTAIVASVAPVAPVATFNEKDAEALAKGWANEMRRNNTARQKAGQGINHRAAFNALFGEA